MSIRCTLRWRASVNIEHASLVSITSEDAVDEGSVCGRSNRAKSALGNAFARARNHVSWSSGLRTLSSDPALDALRAGNSGSADHDGDHRDALSEIQFFHVSCVP